MDNKKVHCKECVCWQQKHDTIGSCRRKSPFTSDMIPSIWPETHPEDFCFEGIKRVPEILND